jgi:TetR/AcrR family transcriptional regulator, cholesterol catabolism regulator
MSPTLTTTQNKSRGTGVRSTKSHAKPLSPSAGALNGDSRFDRRMQHILEHATEVFYDKGYEGASMRDLSRATGISLAGLYYYFESKEKLLYLIQKHTFETVVDRLHRRLAVLIDPEQRIRAFIANHLEYFLTNMKAMKVLSHEDEVLTGDYGTEVATTKREYYRICLGLVEGLKRSVHAAGQASNERCPAGDVDSRLAVLSLFGMMNWIYTWHNRRIDADAEAIARQMGDIFLCGILSGRALSAQP